MELVFSPPALPLGSTEDEQVTPLKDKVFLPCLTSISPLMSVTLMHVIEDEVNAVR
jgi:hypothetical protein